ncbi:MAG TPA: glycosyltransferase family 4 protein [Gaiellaceae bacterium]|nr:glycosyltransferase family 4 protein [Gaiellaceae bacterium]
MNRDESPRQPDAAASVGRLFDRDYYAAQAGVAFASREAALADYLERGWMQGLEPHPLFDARWYTRANPQVADGGACPLLQFLASADAEASPYFDAEHFSRSSGALRRRSSTLVDYVENAARGKLSNPNPLFSDEFYLDTTTSDVRVGEAPLAHYLRQGRFHGDAGSSLVARVLERVRAAERGGLERGRPVKRRVVFLLRGDRNADLAAAAQGFLGEHHLGGVTVFLQAPPELGPVPPPSTVVLDGDVFARPAARRLLALSLASDHTTALLVTDVPDALVGARTARVPAYLLVADDASPAEVDLTHSAADATRVVFGSRAAVRRHIAAGVPPPANIALREHRDGEGSSELISSLLGLARRDQVLDGSKLERRPSRDGAIRKVLVPCADWSVSGVNTALEAIGLDLRRRGWDVEIVFTRDRKHVEQTMSANARTPRLPYRFLERRRAGVDGMWEALIVEFERHAPCIALLGYDFHANSVASALTNNVGTVLWAQSDDADYYEQTYRLGRYCNAVVCVSEQIRDTVTHIHPGIGSRSHVIHNTSVSERDIAPQRRARSSRLRIVYTGRLVQQQKRILDFVELADALVATGLPFIIDLIGSSPPHDEAAALLPVRAAAHIERGTIRLPGVIPLGAILTELRSSDLFVLLSDFEGMPLSVIEAMAAGCVPVVAEMRSGIPEIIDSGRNGLIISGRDYDNWARQITALWSDEGRLLEMSAEAQRTVREGFTAERIGAQFDALLQQVAAETSGGFERPPALTWGSHRAPFGDVLPPPSMYRLTRVPGLA